MADLYAAGASRGFTPDQVEAMEFWQLRGALGQHRQDAPKPSRGGDPFAEQRAHNAARRAESRAARATHAKLTPPMPTWSRSGDAG